MTIPILKQGGILIASVQSAVSDGDLARLEADLATRVGLERSSGVVVDVTAMDVMDSFTIRTLLEITRVNKLRGAETIIVGIQPDVAFSMVQLGLTLEGVRTALDLGEAVNMLGASHLNGHV